MGDWRGDLVSSVASIFKTPIKAGIPTEFQGETELLQYLGLSPEELKKIWWFRHRMYTQFSIAKPGGKERVISAPDKRLKMLQRKIATSLEKIYRPRNPVHGFVRERSVKSNALSHIRAKFLVNLDVEGFFPSISEIRVFGLFKALGICKVVSRILTRICCYMGALPQGAPSSPIISNMICYRLDKELMAFAKKSRCIYTRYADDITFSSYQPLNGLFEAPLPPAGNFSPDLLKTELRAIFLNNGFVINQKKSHYADKHSRQTVTGIRVNELLNVDRRFIRNIRAALFIVEKQGIAEAQQLLKEKYKSQANLVLHLQGRIAWVSHVKGRSDPVFRTLAARFNKLFPDSKLEIAPTADEVRDRAVWVVEHYGTGPKDTSDKFEQGTAFFLKSVGLVTAWHCVKDVTEVTVFHPSKPANKFSATIFKYHKHRDLAVLKHEISATEYYELEPSSRPLHVGDSLIALGYPEFGPGDKINVRPGYICSLPIKRAVRMIEGTQKFSQGMSGGPILVDENTVAGIIHKGGVTTLKDGDSENRDLAIHIDVLKEWIAEH